MREILRSADSEAKGNQADLNRGSEAMPTPSRSINDERTKTYRFRNEAIQQLSLSALASSGCGRAT